MLGLDRPSTRRAQPRPRGGVLVATLFLFLSACAGYRDTESPASADALPPLATRLFTVAYGQINDRYVQPVSLSALNDAGLESVKKLDNNFDIRHQGRILEVREAGEPIAVLNLPEREDDPYRWAAVTVAALDAGRARSPALRASDPEALYQAVFDGVLTQLDPYSRYASRDAARDSRASRDGFGGVGITIDTEGGDVRIANVMPNSPASRSGLAPDDRITHIDGVSLTDMPQREIVQRLRGPIGRTVDITIARPNQIQPITVSITRALVVPPTVTYRRDGDIAYIRLSGFNHRTADLLARQIKAAQADIGPAMEGIILDMRGNLGGLLDQAISVSDLFLSSGQIVSTRGRHRASIQASEAVPGDIAETVPLVVLVNGSSASAAEIVAAALQDNSRAIVVGTTSFGKGSVQNVISLPNEGELVLTWARFYSPSGYPLQDLGILPAICTSGVADPNAVVDMVRRGRLTPPSTMLRWRAADHDDREGLKKLREICTPETRERDVDVDVARRLLADRQLYARTLQSAQLAAKAQ